MLLKTFRFVSHLPWEALIWMAGFVVLASYEPSQEHVSICPLNRLGFTFCPGCGLGRSVSFFFHGEIIHSLTTHPLGIFAVIVLSYRIIQLSKTYLSSHGKNY